MKRLKKGLVVFTSTILFLTVLTVNSIAGFKNRESLASLNAMFSMNQVEAESTSYKGPLCSNQSGTYYCCKGSSGSCSAGAECSSCK